MVRAFVPLVAAAVLVPSFACAVGKPHDISWGKPNVSYVEYRADTLACANTTYGVQVAMQPKTIRALAAFNSSQLWNFVDGLSFQDLGANPAERGSRVAMTAIDPEHVVFRNTTYTETFNHAARWEVVEQLQRVLDTCLVQHGYQRYRLTATQMDRLHGLKRGTDARELYLHSLGSDPRVLDEQRI